MLRMIYGTDKPIIVWAFGKYVSIAEEAVYIYHRDINSDVQFQIIPMSEQEIFEFLNYTGIEQYPNIILVEDIKIKKYLETFLNKFIILDNELDTALIKNYKLPYITDINGHLIGVPCSSGTVALYYRKDIFQRFGIELTSDTTLDDFIEYGKMIHEEDGKYLLPPVDTFAKYLMQSTGQLFYDEYGNVSTQYTDELFSLEKRLADENLIPIHQMEYDGVNQAIIQGDIVSIIGEPYTFSRIKELALNTNEEQVWDVISVPKNSPFLYNANAGDYSWMVVSQEDDNDADYTYVFDFLIRMFNTNDEISCELLRFAANNYDVVPTTSYMSTQLDELDNNGCFEKNVIKFLYLLDYEIPNIYYNRYTIELNNYLNQLSLNVVNDLVTEQDAVLQIQNVVFDDFYEPTSELSSIEIVREPNKKVYFNYEYFDPKGMIIKACFTDGSSYNTTVSMKNILLTVGMTEVTIEYTYNGVTKSTKQSIEVKPRNLIGLQVEVKDRYYFHNYELKKSDFRVWAKYDDGKNAEVNNFEIYPTKLRSCDYEKVTISYREDDMFASEEVEIEVRNTLEAIHIIKEPSKTLYGQGERIQLSGIEVEAEYSNSENENVSPSSLLLSEKYVHFEPRENEKEIIITFKRNGISANASFKVYKKVGTELENADIEQNFDDSGKGVINLNTGLFHYFYDDFSNFNPTCSIDLARCYSPDTNYQSFVGTGWRLNCQQELIRNNGKWTLNTYDGKSYLFDNGFLSENDRASTRNEKLGLDLFFDSTNQKVTLVDRSNNTLVFDKIANVFRLTQIHNYPSTMADNRSAFMTEINYDNTGKLISVVAGTQIDGVRPTVNFVYDNNLLKSINYNGTTVCKYFYDGNKLASIKRCNSNVSNDYEEITSFSYNNHFSIFNQSRKDEFNHFYELRYLTDSTNDKVSSFSYGYGDNDRDVTTILYKKNSSTSLEHQDCCQSVILNYKNDFNIVNLSDNQIISNYSYKIDNSQSNPHLRPKMIMSAQGYGLSPLSINEQYAENLTIVHNDFETTTDGWSGGVLDTEAYVCGTKSIKTSSNQSRLQKEFAEIGGEGTTCYASLWVMNASKISFNINYGKDNYYFSFYINTSLRDMWQYFTIPLGKLLSDFTTTITINGSNLYMDDFRIIRAPYEVKGEFPDIKYNDFGNPEYIREYNPIDDSVNLMRYWYNENHQCVCSRQNSGKSDLIKEKLFGYQNGLLVKVRDEYTKDYYEKYTEENFEYANDICRKKVSVNNVTSNVSYSSDSIISTINGEPNSPSNVYYQKLYGNSNFVDYIAENELQNKYSYNNKGNISKAETGKHNNSYSTILDFTYDTYGNVHETKIGNVALVTQTFDKKKKVSTTFANDTTVNFSYDDEDRIVGVTEDGNSLFNISYVDKTKSEIQITHNNGMIYNSKKVWNNSIIDQYTASKEGYANKLKVEKYATNFVGNESKIKIYTNNLPLESMTLTSDKDGGLTNIFRVGKGPIYTDYIYDELHRLSSKTVKYNHETRYCLFKKMYNYKGISAKQTSMLPEIETLNITYNEQSKEHAYKYEYYNNGNIAKIYKNNVLQSEYTYDSHNRIISEKNATLGKYYTFEYDNSGNIVLKKTYAVINGNIISTRPNICSYDYNTITPNCGQNSSWGDQLKSYNGNPISYDACGNPVSYLGKNMRWKGRTLAEINSILMDYDSSGLRIQKGNKIFYWYNGNLILECWKENDTERFIYYCYDESGVCGMYYNNHDYYFEKNILGDIVAIYDNCGNLLCRYVYDAWGNHKIFDANDEVISLQDENIGNLNPFRYRSYYWDKEFNLYYLKSRYYDPELGRFISPDAISYINPESVMGYNLYAYCNDNPVMYSDGDGNFAIFALILLGLCTPLGALAIQAAVSAVCYVGMAVASIWDESVRNDMNSIGWNPFNSNEKATLNSSKVSFYKGIPVFRTSLDRSGTFGGIFLAKGSEIDDLRHERGHATQFMITGVIQYAFSVGIPSPLKLGNYDDYYSAPWETMADILGGVESRQHSKNEIARAYKYTIFSMFFLPIIILYWL